MSSINADYHSRTSRLGDGVQLTPRVTDNAEDGLVDQIHQGAIRRSMRYSRYRP
jgi:hypothetical protein